MARKPATRSKKAIQSRIPALERIVSAIGLLLTLGAVGVLIADAVQPRTPPDLTARLIGVEATRAGFVAEVEVLNAGRITAENVDVEGVLTPATGEQEAATASLDYVPGGGAEAVTFQFRADPRAGDLELTVRGWSEP